MSDRYSASRRPPWIVVVVVALTVLGLTAINWPAFSGPAKDRHLNQAIHQAAKGSFAPDALKGVTVLDAHRYAIRNFEGLDACPNLEIIYIHPQSTGPWREWADSQFPDAGALTPDDRPTLPLLPKLKEVRVGAPSG